MKEYLGPLSYWDQPEVLTDYSSDRNFDEEKSLLEVVHTELLQCLAVKKIKVISSEARTKSSESIRQKVEDPRRLEEPVSDLYALRVVVNASDIIKTIKSIRRKWPMPKKFPWETKTLRHGQDGNSHPAYRAVHMNFAFGKNKIAEIKLFTPEQLEVEQKTRPYYEKNRPLNR